MTIHYSSTLKLTILKSQGYGECGEHGLISGYEGMITCSECKKIIEQEEKGNEKISLRLLSKL